MKTFKIFNNQLAAITFAQRKIYWDKPTIVGATILDLSKRHMYWFHYMYMKPNFRTLLLYSDTDSLIYEIESEDLYADLEQNTNKYIQSLTFQTIKKMINYIPNIKSWKL